jgi:hypothetical protein
MAVSHGFFGLVKSQANGQGRAPVPQFLRLATRQGPEQRRRVSSDSSGLLRDVPKRFRFLNAE